jgi:NADH-ubiquinone oxidoreductase chain 5
LGDFFLFIFFSFSYFLNFNFFSYIFFLWGPIIFLVLTAFTKRAQFPFRGWLPKAISAPTPVSSLVHRRTLVTAGLLLLFNFSFILINYKIITIIFFIGLLTTFFSSLTAVVEEDIKKVVALSTLSQIGFSILTLGLGYYLFSLVHLLSHALFKSCLFIQVGYLIHCSFGQQDGRYYNNLKFIPYFIQIQLLITLFCLCGLFFYRGLVRKDLILEYFYSNNWYLIVVLLFFSTIYLTFFYSYRLFKIFFLNFSFSFFHFSSSILINFLRFFVFLGSIFFI